MMSLAVTSAGARAREIRYLCGFFGCRIDTCPQASSTPCWARMRLAATRSSISAGSTGPAEGMEAGMDAIRFCTFCSKADISAWLNDIHHSKFARLAIPKA